MGSPRRILLLVLSTMAILGASITLGSCLGRPYFLTSLAALPLIGLAIKSLRESARQKILMSLRKRWGAADVDELKSAENDKHFRKAVLIREAGDLVDDRTWSDLDMDMVYRRMDRTLTIPGEQVLYSLLREPLFSRQPLVERSELIRGFIESQEMRERVQLVLAKLGKMGGGYLVDLLWDDRPQPNKLAFIYPWILLLIPTVVTFGLMGYALGWVGLASLSVGNAIIHYRTKRKISEDLPSIRYLGKLVRCASRLSVMRDPRLNAYWARLKPALTRVSGIIPRTALLSLGENNALYEYLNILFLIEVRAFHSYLRLVNKCETDLRGIFETVGFLDAMAAASSYKTGLTSSTEPELYDSILCLDVECAVHPLLEKPVPVSMSLRQGGMLVTGSNMSGKTTFLKTIGVNALLAQTFHFCLARKFRSSFFNTMTLIGRKDNIIEGKSYYLDEITSLLRIIRSSQRGAPCLCLIDELFRGTNSIERISASAEVLLYLAKKNVLVFASTHDLELTRLVAGAYVNHHFQEEISEQGLVFNYQLCEGPSETRNAIKLLRHIGYPAEITDAADQRIRGLKQA